MTLVPEFTHSSVMPQECLEHLNVQEGRSYVDCTLGGAGHTKLILEKLNGTGHLYCFDQDANVIAKQKEELAKLFPEFENYTLVNANFAEAPEYFAKQDIKIDGGIMMDLGLSSIQLDNPERGFGFLNKGPLDMRMNQEIELTAHDIVNRFGEKDIADILFQLGDERFSRTIARLIVENRPVNTTEELAEIVAKAYYQRSRKHPKSMKIHPATRSFQALRVYVNKELESLEQILGHSRDFMEPGAIIAVLSFQSQEDRIAKWSFRGGEKEEVSGKLFRVINKKPILPSSSEIASNPRSRSAKLRIAEVVAQESD